VAAATSSVDGTAPDGPALRHRVAAADRAGPQLADELAAEADRIVADDPASAAQLLRWSADLTPDHEDRERRTLTAARWLLTNDDPAADQLRAAVACCRTSALTSLLAGQYAYRAGDLGHAEALLNDAVNAASPDVSTEGAGASR
jgi:hypothetical protein